MPSANVHSIAALHEAKAAVDWFIREGVSAVAECDAEVQRTLGWLEREALPHWEREIKRRTDEVAQARSEFYRQQLIANPNTPTALQQRKAWDRAKARLEEAHERAKNVRRWLIQWERESALYKGQISPLSDALLHALPAATARITRLAEILEQYAAIRASEPGAGTPPAGHTATPEPDPALSPDAPFNPLGSPDLPDAFATLRAGTPPGTRRLLIPLTDPAMVAAVPFPIHPSDLQTLGRLGLAGPPPDDEARVTFRSGALAGPMLYLERTPPARADDSGWFVAPAGALRSDDLHCVPMWVMKSKRPDLIPLLSLPVGTLVAIASGRIQALLDQDDADVWPAQAEDDPGTMPQEGTPT